MGDHLNVYIQFEMTHANNVIVGYSIIVIDTLDSDFDPCIHLVKHAISEYSNVNSFVLE